MSTAPIAPRRTRRFWLTVAGFAAANLLAWLAVDRHLAGHRGRVRVTAFEPGDNAVVSPKATMRWRFDDDVVPTDGYARPPGRSTPDVAGRWAWESPRTLAFVPAVGLPRATPVTFTLAPDLIRTPAGGGLDAAYTTSVRPAPLAVWSVRQAAAVDGGYVLELSFSDRVVPGDVLAHLSVSDAGHAVRCRLVGQSAGNHVRVETVSLPAGDAAELAVDLSPGLVGAAGPLGMATAYHATVPLTRVLAAVEMAASAPTRGRPSLRLLFSSTVDPVDLKRVVSVDPPVPFTVTGDDQTAVLNGDFRSGTRYTVRLAGPPADVPAADRVRFPRPGTLSAFVPDVGRDCWLDADQGYLSTAGRRALVARVVNVDRVRVTVTRVYDDNLVAWRNATDRRTYGITPGDYGRPAAERTIACPGPRNERHDVPIRLDQLLPPTMARSGVWLVGVAPAAGAADDDAAADASADDDGAGRAAGRWYAGSRTAALVTLSDIGLTSKRTRDGLVAWATSLRTAAPLAGVAVRAYSDKNQLLATALTDADGLARLSDLHPAAGEAVAVLLADSAVPTAPAAQPGEQSARSELTWLDLRHTAWDVADLDASGRPYVRTGHTAFVYADRGVYRPGEAVHLRAIVRAAGDVAPTAAFPVQWRFRRPDLHEWRTVDAMLDADGGAAADVPLPADLPTGQWSVALALPGADAKPFGSATFLVEEFVPNRLKVGLTLGPADRLAADADVPVDVRADYLFGRPAAGLAVDVSARATPVPFAPAAWADWTFGDAADVRGDPVPSPRSRRKVRAAEPDDTAGTLDGGGRYHGTVDAAGLTHADDPRSRGRGPWRVTVEASVEEAGGRAVTAAKQVDVDAVPAYVAVRRGTAAMPAPGEPCPFYFRLVRPDGTAAGDRSVDLTLRLLRESWNTVTTFHDGQYQYDSTRVLSPVATATVHADGGVADWSPVPPAGGRYVLEATDATGGAVTTTAFYAFAGGGWDDSADRSHPDRLDVRVLGPGEPDAPAADARTRPAARPQRVGTTARVLVAAPFAGRLLLTVETDTVVQSRVIDMPTSHLVVPVDVTTACAPGAFVTATVLRPVDPDAPWHAHRAYGVARLNVDPADRRLAVAIAAPTELRPMHSLDVGVTVANPDGTPAANAAVSVAAVDEGICSLTDFATPDPLAVFTAPRALGVASADLYSLLMPEASKSDVGGDGSGHDDEVGGSRHRSPVGGRRVRPVALAWTTVHTDAAGHAVAAFPVPAFQGQLRVMAVANTADGCGSADRDVTVRSPLLAQTSWPRFAAPGDRFTVPIVLFNNRPAAGTATVAVELVGTDGLLSFDGTLPPVPLSANGQGRVDLPITVGQMAGVARVRLTAAMDGESYREDLELPVRPAAAMTQVGGIARGTAAAPTRLAGVVPMLPGTGSLTVNVTPWPALNLPKGLDYLARYPYGCAEQTTSTLFPLVALGEIGRRVDPVRFDPQRIHDKVQAGVVQLIGMQTADGGLAMWPGGSADWPWASVYAAHFLTVARADGHPVPDDFYDHLLAYVHRQLDVATDAPGELEVQAYAAYVLSLAGHPDRPAMDRLVELAAAADRPGDLPDGHNMRGDAQLFLASAWLLAGRRDLAEDMLPAAMPPPRTARQHDGNLGSPVRDRAIQVLTLEQVQPDRPDLPDLVQRLADDGVADRWASTQDVAYATLAVGQYLQLQATHHPLAYASAKLLLDGAVLAESRQGTPLTWTGAAAAGAWRVELTGPVAAVGHIGWLQTGVPLTPPPAASHGLTVRRRYLGHDGREVDAVRTGDLVRVELTLDGPADLANVVLEDLLPAGLEVENGRLATAAHGAAATVDVAPPRFDGITDVRDDRVVIVGQIGPTGRGVATVLTRAVTPGVYVDPPARAEAMYDLNTNGNTAAGRFTVTAADASTVAGAE